MKREIPEPLAKELENLEAAASILFGNSPIFVDLASLTSKARADLQDVFDQRQVHSALVAVCGGKNSGKSWLCRSLITSKEKREMVRSGFDQDNSTTLITWIGPETPARLESDFEQAIPVAANQMADLGKPYLLLDVPGHNDLDGQARLAAKRCVRMASLRVFITSIRTLDAEDAFHYLGGNDGSTILPLIADPKYPRMEKVDADVARFLGRLARSCPAAEVLPPVFIPQFDLAADPAQAERDAMRLAHEALRNALPRASRNTAQMAQLIRAAFRAEFKKRVEPVFARIRPHHKDLGEAENQVLRTILEDIVGTDRQLFSGVRLQLLDHAASGAPLFFFPFRTFLGLVSLTAGAWDRLVLGLSGSVPSLALAAFQGLQNVRSRRSAGLSQRDRLKKRIHRLAEAQLEPRARIFSRAVQESGAGGAATGLQTSEGGINVEGLDRMIDESFGRMQAIIEEFRPRPGVIACWGLVATVVFWGLLAGPLVAIYRHFLNSWSQVFLNSETTWDRFPTPSAAMLFTSLLLVALPVFFLALAALSFAARKKQVERCVQAIRDSHAHLLKQVIGERRIWIAAKDPLRDAASLLMSFVDDAPDARDAPETRSAAAEHQPAGFGGVANDFEEGVRVRPAGGG